MCRQSVMLRRLARHSTITTAAWGVRWHTTGLNDWLCRGGDKQRRRCWFTCGVWCALALLPPSLGVLLLSCVNQLRVAVRLASAGSEGGDSANNVASWTLRPMIPGVNRPWADVPVYAFVLLLCTIVHEMGHAMAAVRERVSVHGCGVMLVLCVPAAYVELDGQVLSGPLVVGGGGGATAPLSLAARLRVLCAGVWHNVVLATTAAVFVSACTAAVTRLTAYSLGSSGGGLEVVSVSAFLSGPSGLAPGDTMTAVDHCVVHDLSSLQLCLSRYSTPQRHKHGAGFCVSRRFIAEHNTTQVYANPQHRTPMIDNSAADTVACCQHDAHATHMCFSSDTPTSAATGGAIYSCLPARVVLQHNVVHTRLRCLTTADCRKTATNGDFNGDNVCVTPALIDSEARLISISRRRVAGDHDAVQQSSVLFVGRPDALTHSLAVRQIASPYVDALYALRRVCAVTAAVSAGLALVNVVPAHGFDGQHIWHALLLSAAETACGSGGSFQRRIRLRQRAECIARLACHLGTGLLAVWLVLSLGNEAFGRV